MMLATDRKSLRSNARELHGRKSHLLVQLMEVTLKSLQLATTCSAVESSMAGLAMPLSIVREED